jgi:allantoicase
MTETALPDFAKNNINLAAPRIGAETLSCSDDFFAPMHRMLQESEAVFITDKYDDHGKWMDGWESRRRRGGGYDWCIVKLGVPGKLKGALIDTAHFTGNYPPGASIEAAFCEGSPDDGTNWQEILGHTDLKGDAKHWFEFSAGETFTHVRLNMLPDGGIARFKVYGEPAVDWDKIRAAGAEVNLAAMELGARALAWTDAHYGDPNKALSPGLGENMGDGWETRRRREPGNDWLILKLAHPGQVARVLVDTKFFKGNYPDRCSIDAINVDELTEKDVSENKVNWQPLLTESKLEADQEHFFELGSSQTISHIRLNIFPDGGVSRLRLFGKAVSP